MDPLSLITGGFGFPSMFFPDEEDHKTSYDAQINCGLINIDGEMAIPDYRRGKLVLVKSSNNYEIVWLTRPTMTEFYKIELTPDTKLSLCNNRILHLISEKNPNVNRIFWIQEADASQDSKIIEKFNNTIDKLSKPKKPLTSEGQGPRRRGLQFLSQLPQSLGELGLNQPPAKRSKIVPDSPFLFTLGSVIEALRDDSQVNENGTTTEAPTEASTDDSTTSTSASEETTSTVSVEDVTSSTTVDEKSSEKEENNENQPSEDTTSETTLSPNNFLTPIPAKKRTITFALEEDSNKPLVKVKRTNDAKSVGDIEPVDETIKINENTSKKNDSTPSKKNKTTKKH